MMAPPKYPAKDHVSRTFRKVTDLLQSESKQCSKPQAALLAGSQTAYRNDTDRELPFRQESNFFYLTGCAVPGSFFLATYHPPTDTTNDLASSFSEMIATTLYIPKPTIEDLMWSPAPPTLSEALAAFDVDAVFHIDALSDHIKALPSDVVVHVLPCTDDFPRVERCVGNDSPILTILGELGARGGNAGSAIEEQYLLPALHQTRLIKDAFEIGLIRRANEISSRAHEVVMRVLGLAVQGKIKQGDKDASGRPWLPGEWLIETEAEAEAVFVASCRREGASHQAYLPIVAAGIRAATLHYCCNDKAFAWGPIKDARVCNDGHLVSHLQEASGGGRELAPQILLIDAGCELECYSSDITRAMAVGNDGKFTIEARAIYDLVLKMQQESLAIIRPGVHWDDVQLRCHEILIDGFLHLGIFRKSSHSDDPEACNVLKSDILNSGISAAFFPHGVGHSMGLDVHDVPSASKPPNTGKYFVSSSGTTGGKRGGHESFYKFLRLRLPLQAGMVVTVEPGIYFSPHLLAPHRNSPLLDAVVLAQYESVGGIRIEDDILVTANGAENLTAVRSDTAWVESVCSGEA